MKNTESTPKIQPETESEKHFKDLLKPHEEKYGKLRKEQKRTQATLSLEDPCKNFTTDKLPEALKVYVESIAKETNAHPLMITCSAISAVSGFMKTFRVIPQGEYFQDLYANIWSVNILKSGGFKTTAIRKGARHAFDRNKEVLKELKEIKQDNPEYLPISISSPILPEKITSEGLLEHVSQGHGGTIYCSELGAWLQNLEKNHNADMKSIMTELYDVPSHYRYKTKTSGDHHLENPFISICGVSTMNWIKSYLTADNVNSGFFARYLFYLPPHDGESTPPALPPKGQHNESGCNTLDLVMEHASNPTTYTITDEARSYYIKQHDALYDFSKNFDEDGRELLDPFLKRWSPYMLKLAMVMRTIEDPHSTEITVSSIDQAMNLIWPAVKSTALLFKRELGESKHQKKSRLVMEWIKKKTAEGKAPTWGELLSSNKLEGGAADYNYVIEFLVESGQVDLHEGKTKKEGRISLCT